MMRVAYTTADQQAVGAYRVRWPIEALAAQGEIEIAPCEELKIGVTYENHVFKVDPPEADVLVLQRTTNKFIADSIPFYQRAGLAVIVELDDDLERVGHAHAQHDIYSPQANPDENWRHLKRACNMADLVIVSTQALVRYAPHGRVAVLDNYVPERYLSIKAERKGRLIVGWGGTVLNHPGDLQVTRGGVAQALRETGDRFLVVGDGAAVKSNLDLDEEPETTGFLPIDEYPHHVARFDIGLAPLEATTFSRAKTWLKLVEYSALGVPWVASVSSPEYQRFAGICEGELVKDRARSWKRAIVDLLRNQAYREAIVMHNRNVVAEQLTIEGNAWRWAEQFEVALANREGAKCQI